MMTRLTEKPAARRSLAAVLVVAGALLLWLAPQTWLGAGVLGVGVLLELAGMVLARRRDKPSRARFRKLDDLS